MMGEVLSFKDKKDGSTAVEFGLIGPIFFGLLFSLIELAWLLTRVVVVTHVVHEAARDVKNGEISSVADFEQAVCDRFNIISNCANNILTEAVIINGLSDIPSTSAQCQASSNETFKPAVDYDSGNGSETVFLRVCVIVPLVTPGLGLGASLPQTSSGEFAIVASIAFQNEPF